IRLGLIFWFWLIVGFWAAFFLLYLFTPLYKTFRSFLGRFLLLILMTLVISKNIIPALKIPQQGASVIKLAPCTSTLADTPKMLDAWKVTIYSAPLLTTGSNEVANANNIRTFSYSGIKNKTEPNSLHTRFEKVDYSFITGYDSTMELCNQDNMGSFNYVTKNRGQSAAGDNTVASVNFLHGGSYLFGPGTYRVDAYIKDLSGVWHLVDRMTGITITE
ncbi:MAG: hypothetical protein WC784_06170, partial [Candidatus Shapirobacteria bacterium]